MAAICHPHVGQIIANKFAPTANRRRLGGDEESPFGGKAGAHKTHQIHEKIPDRSAVGAQGKRNVWRCVMSRIGKIARLPKAIREELNRRLEDGEQQNHLVDWLNGHAEVQAVLKAQYDGKPINEPNLTAWKQGGYVDWLRQQEALDVAERLVEETSELGALAQGQLMADRVAMMAALAIGEQLMAARRMEDGAEKRRTILKLVRGLVRLRKSDREQERAMRDEEAEQRRRDYHEDWVERIRKPKEPFAELSDAELMRRIEEVRNQDIASRGDAVAWEEGGETVDDDWMDGETLAVGTVTFEVRGGEAHGHLAGGEQARIPAAAGPMAGKPGQVGAHETHELHEKMSDGDSGESGRKAPPTGSSDGAGGLSRHCRIGGNLGELR